LAISGNPHKLAMDIAVGFTNVTVATLKKYSPPDLKVINTNLGIVMRELRQIQIPLEDVMAIKMKNMKIQRVNSAMMVIRNYCKKKRIMI